MAKKERLDIYLYNNGFFRSRHRAKGEIMAGNIFVNGMRIDKPGTLVNVDDIKIEIKGKTIPYVSRGGLKLEKALEVFNITTKNKTAIDAGASTGGFTDCLLQKGVKKVYAVDVGYGQFDYTLRTDKRVVLFERKNIRYLSFDDIKEHVDIITADLSFISLSKVFNVFYNLIKDDGCLITLIKPQFEVDRTEVGKNGVVKDSKLHVKAIETVFKSANEIGFFEQNLTFSPIKGPKGNIEFLAYFTKQCKQSPLNIKELVECAHKSL